MLFLAKIFLTDARYEEAINNQKSDSTIFLLQSHKVMKFSVTDSKEFKEKSTLPYFSTDHSF